MRALALNTLSTLYVYIAVSLSLSAPAAAVGVYDDDLEILRARLRQRGDANNDGNVDVSDVAAISGWLFLGRSEPPCLNQADTNDDGQIDLSDSIFLSAWLYGSGPAPAPPSFAGGSRICGSDLTPIGCKVDPCVF